MFISRKEWGAKPPKENFSNIGQVDTVFFHHSATPASNDPKNDVRNIQSGEMAKGYADIAYHILIHPDGSILEGRIYDGIYKKGAATLNNNSSSLAICFIGNYVNQEPSALALEAAAIVLSRWVIDGRITKKYRGRAHNDVFATACPGKIEGHIPSIMARANEILYGNQPSNEGVLVQDFMAFNANITLDENGNGWTEIIHSKGRDPIIALATINGNQPEKEGYPKIGDPALLTSCYDGRRIKITCVGGQPKGGFGIKVLAGW